MTLEIITSPSLDGVSHGFFTRRGGASSGVYAGLNCGAGSDDLRDAVELNRARVADALGLAREALVTVHQTHSADVVTVTGPLAAPKPEADAMVTATPGVALAILTADCEPVLFADAEAGVIGAAHAGWKGALDGVLEATVEAMEALGADRARVGVDRIGVVDVVLLDEPRVVDAADADPARRLERARDDAHRGVRASEHVGAFLGEVDVFVRDRHRDEAGPDEDREDRHRDQGLDQRVSGAGAHRFTTVHISSERTEPSAAFHSVTTRTGSSVGASSPVV